MKNREKHAKEIIDVACQDERFTVDKNGNVGRCGAIHCFECIFKIDNSCKRAKLISEWCEAEYVEKPTLTVNEKAFLELIAEPFKYIARDENGALYLYSNPPERHVNEWHANSCTILWNICINCFSDVNFGFIKWEDEKPWSIDDLKKLEVRDEY